MYTRLFGPVPSRRLGMSLGIDLVPHKVCSFNCVYCECGRTTELTTERKEYISANEVINQLNHYFTENPFPDYITFSGAGEPCLNSGIGRLIEFIKESWPPVPVAVLTNGSLFYDPFVRRELTSADVVLPSLDAVSPDVFHRMDRPHHSLTPEGYIDGLVKFREEFSGEMRLEVMILPGYNDNAAELELLKKAFMRIKPDLVQLNTLDRPGTLDNLMPVSRNGLQKIVEGWGLENVEIIAAVPERQNTGSYRTDFETAVLETIARRPCTVDDLGKICGTHINEVNKYLGVLEEQGKIETIRRERGVFYRLPVRGSRR